jgi:hypothetical protein
MKVRELSIGRNWLQRVPPKKKKEISDTREEEEEREREEDEGEEERSEKGRDEVELKRGWGERWRWEERRENEGKERSDEVEIKEFKVRREKEREKGKTGQVRCREGETLKKRKRNDGQLGCIQEGLPLWSSPIGWFGVQQELAGISAFPRSSLVDMTGVAAARIKDARLGVWLLAYSDWSFGTGLLSA